MMSGRLNLRARRDYRQQPCEECQRQCDPNLFHDEPPSSIDERLSRAREGIGAKVWQFCEEEVNETALLDSSLFLSRSLRAERNQKTINVTKVTLDGDKGPVHILFRSLSGEGPLFILFGA
jgi:hypothetical protein